MRTPRRTMNAVKTGTKSDGDDDDDGDGDGDGGCDGGCEGEDNCCEKCDHGSGCEGDDGGERGEIESAMENQRESSSEGKAEVGGVMHGDVMSEHQACRVPRHPGVSAKDCRIRSVGGGLSALKRFENSLRNISAIVGGQSTRTLAPDSRNQRRWRLIVFLILCLCLYLLASSPKCECKYKF